jgi:putative Ca2+/H+ antiporter (TMEM165/GDT1 family)
MGLQTRGWMRSLVRKLRTVKGALLGIVGLGVVVLWLLAVTASPKEQAGINPDDLRRHAPTAFIAYCVLTVLMSRGERAFYFSPAEVNFLFPGPFTRRQLLIYKITVIALIGVPTTLFLTLILRVHANWWVAAFAGLYLAYLFMQLFAVAVSLLGISIGARAYTRTRKMLLIALGVLVAVLLFRQSQYSEESGLRGLFRQLEDSEAWKTITAPLSWIVETFLVEPGDWLDLAKWGGLGVGVTAFFVILVVILDAQYLESVASTSERLYTQIQKMRRGEAVSLHWTGSSTARWGLPAFPWWGGAGPIAWRQMTTALRSLGRLAIVVMVLLPVMIGPMMADNRKEDSMPVVALMGSLLVWLSLLLTTLVPFDFRGDLDRMDVLKTLPLPAWRVALGQLLTPVLILELLQAVTVLVCWICLPLGPAILFWGLAFTVPLNFLLFGLDNLLFLWFPSRIWATSPGDFQALGRNVLIILTKMVVLGVVALVSFCGGWLGYFLSGNELPVGLAVSWLMLSICSALIVPMVAMAFRIFDVSSDMPA